MNILRKVTASIALVSLMMIPQVTSAADMWGNVGIVSDYFWRGDSQNNSKPALQAELGASSGRFYGGVWVSQVDFENEANIEYDFFAGANVFNRGDFSLDIGVTQYNYDNVIDSVEEASLSAQYKFVSATYYRDLDNSDNTYTEVGLSVPFISYADVSVNYGEFRQGGHTANITVEKNLSDSLVASLLVMNGDLGNGLNKDNVAVGIHYNF